MEPKVGSFCWLELATTNASAAKTFYSNLFAWAAEDMTMGPEMSYTIFRIGGNDVAGAYGLMKEQLELHVPPHWMLYVKVDSVDASAAQGVQLGGKQIVGPSDIPDVGRFAVLQDPTGAHISIFQTGQHHGIQVFGDVGSLCWADLNTQDAEKAAKFYSDWFGWTYEVGKDGYRHIINGSNKEDMIGGIPPQMHAPPGTPSHWMAYFHVSDCKASAEKAVKLGSTAIMAANLIPDVGTIAVIADPQGAVFALYQPTPRT